MNWKKRCLDSRVSPTICGETCSALEPRLSSVAVVMLDMTLEQEVDQANHPEVTREAQALQLDRADHLEALAHQERSQHQQVLPHRQLQEVLLHQALADLLTHADVRLEQPTLALLDHLDQREFLETQAFPVRTDKTVFPEKTLKMLLLKLTT